MQQHAVVIGAGVVGCLSALALVERGWRVTLIDQGSLGNESSWAGGGILFPLLPWKYSEPVNRLALAGAARHEALCAQLLDETGIDPQYQRHGMQVLPELDLETALTWCRANNVAAESRNGGLWLPDVAQARNPRLMQALRAMVSLRGITLVEHTQLTPLADESGHITHWHDTQGRAWSADAYVITAGAWSQQLLGQYALSLDMKPMRGQMLLYQLPPETLPHILYHQDFYLIPRKDGHILAGSTVEDVGFDKATTPDIASELADKAAALLPQLADSPVIKHWSGLRPGSPDNIPVIDRHPGFDNLYLNAGHFRYGVTMAPASAKILAAVMSREVAPDAALYAFPTSEKTAARASR